MHGKTRIDLLDAIGETGLDLSVLHDVSEAALAEILCVLNGERGDHPPSDINRDLRRFLEWSERLPRV